MFYVVDDNDLFISRIGSSNFSALVMGVTDVPNETESVWGVWELIWKVLWTYDLLEKSGEKSFYEVNWL